MNSSTVRLSSLSSSARAEDTRGPSSACSQLDEEDILDSELDLLDQEPGHPALQGGARGGVEPQGDAQVRQGVQVPAC